MIFHAFVDGLQSVKPLYLYHPILQVYVYVSLVVFYDYWSLTHSAKCVVSFFVPLRFGFDLNYKAILLQVLA